MSLDFCETGLDGVQVSWVIFGALTKVFEDRLSDQIRLMLEQGVLVDIEDCGFDVVRVVFEKEIFPLLDELKVEIFGCVDDIPIVDGEIFDGVFPFG